MAHACIDTQIISNIKENRSSTYAGCTDVQRVYDEMGGRTILVYSIISYWVI